MGFLKGNSRLKSGITFDFITQSKLLGGSTPQTPRVDSFKLSIADFESINLIEDSQVYLFLIKRVSHNN
ncbi:MAG: hypothetical protein EWV41_00050 [Microcystis wesenbergii Mw_MB_S_20031200_S109]|uniref:Uncharacterized protein n=1 Tax=Microcystis wesenbergii Mw_MB_S_20031200_S109D TaxID=2486241 RepID=A0A552LWB0_9CHRO|nr:MAG: hypothetical protein EWV41_00050 [Microcystis wesenbergii Mw_MB_S_20031200_S109]TRV24504.1 MAG: hypothetical protein EWV88_09445 [Microcystis wesenbergii Mw_MB_S_20031200_S109D]